MAECFITRRGGVGGLDTSTLNFHVRKNIYQGGPFNFTADSSKDYLVVANGGDGAFVMIIHGITLKYAYGWLNGSSYTTVSVSDHFSVSGNVITISGSGLFNGCAWIHTNDSALT